MVLVHFLFFLCILHGLEPGGRRFRVLFLAFLFQFQLFFFFFVLFGLVKGGEAYFLRSFTRRLRAGPFPVFSAAIILVVVVAVVVLSVIFFGPVFVRRGLEGLYLIDDGDLFRPIVILVFVLFVVFFELKLIGGRLPGIVVLFLVDLHVDDLFARDLLFQLVVLGEEELGTAIVAVLGGLVHNCMTVRTAGYCH